MEKKYEGQMSVGELSNRLLVREYGHTIQSLILGPFYLIVIGIPYALWEFVAAKKSKKEPLPYGAFFTEAWTIKLGLQVTAEASIGMPVSD